MPINVQYDDVGAEGQAAFTAGQAPIANDLLDNQLQSMHEDQRQRFGLYNKALDEQHDFNKQNRLFSNQQNMLGQRLDASEARLTQRLGHQDAFQAQAKANQLELVDHKNEQQIQADKIRFTNRQQALRSMHDQDVAQLKNERDELGPITPENAQQVYEYNVRIQQALDGKMKIKGTPTPPPPMRDPVAESQNHKWSDPDTGNHAIGMPPKGSRGFITWTWDGSKNKWELDKKDANPTTPDVPLPVEFKMDQEQVKGQQKEWEHQNKLNQDEQRVYDSQHDALRQQYLKDARDHNVALQVDTQRSFADMLVEADKWADDTMRKRFPNGRPQMLDPRLRPQIPGFREWMATHNAGPKPDQAPAPAGPQPPAGPSGQSGLPQINKVPDGNSPETALPLPPRGKAQDGVWYTTPHGQRIHIKGEWKTPEEFLKDSTV